MQVGQVDTGPRQCVFGVVGIVTRTTDSTNFAGAGSRPCYCVRVKGVTTPRCMTDELPLDERVLRRIAVRDMPQRTQIRITYRQQFTHMRIHRTDYGVVRWSGNELSSHTQWLLDYYYRLQVIWTQRIYAITPRRARKGTRHGQQVRPLHSRAFVCKGNCAFMGQPSDGACCDMPHNQ